MLPPPPPQPAPQMQQHMQPAMQHPSMQQQQVQQPQMQQQLQIHPNAPAPEAFPNARGSICQMHTVQVRQGAPRNPSAPPIHRAQMYMLQAETIRSPKGSATLEPDEEVNMIQKGSLTTRE